MLDISNINRGIYVKIKGRLYEIYTLCKEVIRG
jgi:hypothetical protein